ncbi:MFS general substrate transporter [Mycena venus]|uniref:MFS general substrate transporter n=1 Tax=Mycena venus TaxID=2733690 RepID=A0A8H7DE14_9AGAR|nr:MFS general substrate transporter [Mycena venus]
MCWETGRLFYLLLELTIGKCGLLATAIHGITSIPTIYYLSVFQACFGASPIRSAVDSLPGSLITTPFVLPAGVIITLMKHLVSTLREDSSIGKWVGYQLVGGTGVGILFSSPVFPLLAPLPSTRAGSAFALFSFTRAFAQTCGITVSGTILQNSLKKNLPAAFVAKFSPGFEIAYAAIPVIHGLEQPLRDQVRAAFALSILAIWQTMIGIAGLGLLFSLLMVEVPIGTTVDKTYMLKESKQKVEDAEVH